MRKKLIFSSLLMAMCCNLWIGCSNDDVYSIVPHFSTIECRPNPVTPGDSITLTARQDQMGKLINATSYDWSFSYQYFYDGAVTKDTTVYLPTVKTNYDGISNADPVIGFHVPTNIAGNLTVTINAFYSLSAQSSSGALYGQANRTNQIPVNLE
jgi:hypothetical protein